MIKLGGLVELKALNEEEVFTATNKETGNVSVFKSKASRDAAVKSGSHEMKKNDKEDGVEKPELKKDTPKVNIFNKDKEEPKSEPSQPKRQGNPQVNKATLAKAKELGITPQKLGKEEYQKKMAQAAVAALTDANFHSEARELISKLEGKPEWAEDPRKSAPDISSPEYDEWSKSSVYSSEYYDAEGEVEDLGISAAQEASWSGDDAADSIAFTLRMNGFHKLADTIQSVIKENKSTRLGKLLPEGFVVMYKMKKDLKNMNIGPSQVKYDDKSEAEKFLKSVEKDGGKGMIVSDKAPKSTIDRGI